MDGSVWVGLAGTLAGTTIGGGLSIWASVVAQSRQAKATRDLRIEEKAEAAMEEAITQLYVIKQRARECPRNHDELDTLQEDLRRLAAETEPVVLRLRDDELRERVEEVLGYISRFDELDDHLGHWSSTALTSKICQYGLDCLGAAVRDRPLPAPSPAILKAREIDADIQEVMRISREEAER
ncbi:hypothetical protein [Streptomyces sp. enrichment culture]|uniref:hypothetical protein n=1 Tax=Streptomyces sp. enrichment culture TaxID=1795815 RepID=UPI003F574EEB